MWLFKKQEVIDFKDYAESLDMPPCKNKQVHYHWVTTEKESRSCPRCAANILRRKELDDLDVLADKIVEKLMDNDKFTSIKRGL